jgi:hypothetical protein
MAWQGEGADQPRARQSKTVKGLKESVIEVDLYKEKMTVAKYARGHPVG